MSLFSCHYPGAVSAELASPARRRRQKKKLRSNIGLIHWITTSSLTTVGYNKMNKMNADNAAQRKNQLMQTEQGKLSFSSICRTHPIYTLSWLKKKKQKKWKDNFSTSLAQWTSVTVTAKLAANKLLETGNDGTPHRNTLLLSSMMTLAILETGTTEQCITWLQTLGITFTNSK